ncbi:hypothetical protein K439DRAFT_1368403, partial [Ramaria rubella]
NPPESVLSIIDKKLFSFKQFLVCAGTSQETYSAVRENHNEYLPDTPMLSYEQVQNRVAEWSGIKVIVHDMYPNLCKAYTGPYSELEECPYEVCGESCWDTF